MKLTHIDSNGSAVMVDVGEKEITNREAVAQAVITMKPETLRMIVDGEVKKGDVLATARIAGIMAAKRTSDSIPLCHPLPLTSVQVEIHPLPPEKLLITTIVRCKHVTGVEMEALMAASIAALTIYDMCKAVDRGMRIDEVYLLRKSGGWSGLYERASIKRIYLKTQKGGKKLSMAECNIDENGIEGYTMGDKAISLVDIKACISMEQENSECFCGNRFYANFVTEGLNYMNLKVGDVLQVGDACFEITQVGKPCFEGCELLSMGKICMLKDHCAFAKVVHPGTVKIGSRFV